jgi:hypothetical protein
MSEHLIGRVVAGNIELDAPAPALEGKRVRVTLEVLEDGEHPARRAFREAPPDERPYTEEERAAVEAAKRNGEYITTEELRARLAAAHHADALR